MRFGRHFYCLSLVTFSLLFRLADSFIKPTNIVCKALDTSFVDFEICRLRVQKRGVIAMSIYAKLLQMPVNKINVNLGIFKKDNGYRPFMYNISADFCAFMTNKKRYPFLKMYMELFEKASNINHTCPFAHDIIINDLVLQDDFFSRNLFPSGEYMFKIMIATFNDWKVDVSVYLSINLNRKGHKK